jgi:plastocyanin
VNTVGRGLTAGVVLAIAAGSAGGVLASSAHTHALATTKTVKVIDTKGSFAFKPKTLTIKAGTKVTWQNVSQAPHTVTFKHHLFDKNLGLHGKVSFTFKKKGTYTYICNIHPFMKAKVVVK